MEVLEVNNLKKIYTTRFGGNKVEALHDINFSVEQGEYVAIMGESGSGKTTLLNILAADIHQEIYFLMAKTQQQLRMTCWQNSGENIWDLYFRILIF